MGERSPAAAAFFSADYATARARFRAAAQAAGARPDALPLRATGPHGEPLTIDLAWMGSDRPARALVHTSGIHGVEAFAGSAIQLALLDHPPRIAAGTALVLAHVLNPYGMAWLRRTNENNVDLNRNCLGSGASWSGSPPLYGRLDALLNPRTPPRRDAFLLRAALCVARYGYPRVKQAVARGQYDHPRGLFYGGSRLEEGPTLYFDWLRARLRHALTVLAVDVHTGLGRYGEDTLLVEPGYRASPELEAALGRTPVDAASRNPTAYVVRGGLSDGLREALPGAALHSFVQEFGTYSVPAVLSALREENRWHFYGSGGIEHAAKSRLLHRLNPADAGWRERVVARGVAVAQGGLQWLQERSEHGV